MNTHLHHYFDVYSRHRPLFLSLIRAKEAMVYHRYLPIQSPSLDVGCGDGFFCRTVFGHIDIGLDVSGSRISEARRNGGYTKLIIYSGDRIPFASHSFQTIVSNCVLEHIPNIRQTIEELYRVLRPGGRALVTVMAKPWEDYLFGAKIFGSWYTKYMRAKQHHVNLLTYEEWNTRFQSAGFHINKAIGYLSPNQCALIDAAHYFSVPSLVSYKLTGTWVPFPQLVWYPKTLLAIMQPRLHPSRSGAVLYELIA